MSCGPTPTCQSLSAHPEKTTSEPVAPVLGHDFRLLLRGPPSYSQLYAVASATLPRAVALAAARARAVASPRPLPTSHTWGLCHMLQVRS